MSLIIKITQNGSSQEYLFNKLGPILIGSGENCDLVMKDSHIESKLLEVKVSGGNIFVKEVGARAEIYLDSVILPYKEETRYHEGNKISLKNTNYQITIHRSQTNVEPPPFFDGEFKDRLKHMSMRIHERENELKALDEVKEKKKVQINDLEDRSHRYLNEKVKLEVEVNHLKSERDTIAYDLKKSTEKNQDTEDKIIQLNEFIRKLESEEKRLKDTIVAQTFVLSSLKEEREKKGQDVETQRQVLAGLELDTLKAQEELKAVKNEFELQGKEIAVESGKVQKILHSSEEALKEGAKIQKHIAHGLKEKLLLDHEVEELHASVAKLNNEYKDSHNKLLDLKMTLAQEEQHSEKIKAATKRFMEEETNLKLINDELRGELVKMEEKLSSKKNLLNQVDFETQDVTRKLASIQYELERSSLRLKELTNEEKLQELKVVALREEFNHSAKKVSDDRRDMNIAIEEEKLKAQQELSLLQQEIEEEKKNLASLETKKDLAETTLSEIKSNELSLTRHKNDIEKELDELKAHKTLIEKNIGGLKTESSHLLQDKDRLQRELVSLNIKFQECESRIKESQERAHLEIESYKREERSKIQAEKEVLLSEVEAFRQKSLIEVENEYRRKENDIHQKRTIALRETDSLIDEARRKEAQITQEASKRLMESTIEAQKRESESHLRIKEAQDYFKDKEKEADEIIQRARLDSREFLKRTELELQDDLAKRKVKIKKFLTMKQENGLLHIKNMTDQHQARLRRSEEKAHDKLEDLKRKELKKIARLRDEELTRQNEARSGIMNDLKRHKDKALKEINEMKKTQEAELAERKKSSLEQINTNKHRQQSNWEEELKRDKEQFARTKKERIENATQAALNVFIAESGSLGEKEAILKEKLKATLSMAIDGQNAHAMNEVSQILDFNPLKRKKILPVFQKYALKVGVPAVFACVILADVGGVRTSIVEGSKDLMKQQHSASEIYVNQQKTEWKEKHTYTPELTVGYKPTYVDNVVYTKDFEKVMDNEEFQNDWILKVHDFMVRDLELSEDLAINFISSEGTLIKELATARKDLHPKFLDQGMKKMKDLEKTHLGWLEEKIPDVSKRERFTSFRKDYFDKFYEEKFINSRELASDKTSN